MNKKIIERIERISIKNNAIIEALTAEQRHEWYLRIKDSMPLLRKMHHDADAIAEAIISYEQKHGIE